MAFQIAAGTLQGESAGKIAGRLRHRRAMETIEINPA